MGWGQLLDMIFPRFCAGCGRDVGEEAVHLCWECLADTAYIQAPFCARCGDPVEGRVDEAFVCYNCAGQEPYFDCARSAARFRGVMQKILRDFKYHDALWLKQDLARFLETCTRSHYEPDDFDLVVAVPLYAARQRERGYNQSALLAQALARRLGKPYVAGCLARIKPTQTQTHLTARERATNVRGAFKAGRLSRLEGQGVLLVDDVMTTGATVNECARALKEGGANRVFVVTIARG